MANKWHLVYWLAIVAVYFIGRFNGTEAEMRQWLKAAILGYPMIRMGVLFKIEEMKLGGDNSE